MKLALGLIFAGCLITIVSLAGGAMAYAMVGWLEKRWPGPADDAAPDDNGEPLDDEEEEAFRGLVGRFHEPEAEVDR